MTMYHNYVLSTSIMILILVYFYHTLYFNVIYYFLSNYVCSFYRKYKYIIFFVLIN